ncbi:MAG: DMT family transporter [Chlorobi bacterium]|nr:DMT family transporter [Chlorobiota bacterium]
MDLTKKRWQWALLLLLSIIWGSSFILMKKGLEVFNNNQVAAFRIFISFLVLFPLIMPRLGRIKKHHIKSLLIVGIIGNFLPAFLFTKAQTQIDSSIAGILNSLVPLFALLIGLLFYRSHVLLINILGILLGLAGAIGLIYDGSQDLFHQANLYGLFVVIATVCYGVSINEIKYKLADLDGVTIASAAFFIIGPFAFIVLVFSNLPAAFSHPQAWQSLGYIALLAIMSSAIAVVLFNILIKYTTAIFAASVTYIIPIFAIFWGLFDGEKISVQQLLWMSVILIGVYLVNKKHFIHI